MAQRFYSTREAICYLYVDFNLDYSEKYLAKLRSTGGGPKYAKIGSRVYYLSEHLDEWVLSRCNMRRTTSDSGPTQALRPL